VLRSSFDATSEKTVRLYNFGLPDRRFRSELTRPAIARHPAEENLRPHADSGSAEAHEEKIDSGEITHTETDRHAGEIPDAETNANAGEIAVIEEKERRDSNAVRDAISECLSVGEKEKIFAQPVPGIFSERVEQEKETQNFTLANSIARRIAGALDNSERNP
jgi:hypothetical protein